MNREQLAHVPRSAATIALDGDILVLGSQSILATADAENLPANVTMSVEADLAFFDDPDERKMDLVEGAIGESSPFHEQFGYYGQGVTLDTAVLPVGWRDRLVRFEPLDALPTGPDHRDRV